MKTRQISTVDDRISLLDLDAMANPSDKVSECEYFLRLASSEPDRQHFRWLVSAFLSAAHSYFDISAVRAYIGFTNPETGASMENSEAVEVLRPYVKVTPGSKKDPGHVNTKATHEITEQLYKLRHGNTHRFPLSILTTAENFPEDFQFGNITGEGIPVLRFCRETMCLIRKVERELQRYF